MIESLFAEFRPRRIEAALGDFSGLRSGAPAYWELAPRTAGTAQRILQTAHGHGIPLRVRAQGHSLNGASLPRPGELLFSTRNLRHVRFKQPGTVTAGAGVVLWVLQYLLRRHGHDLPVLNDGYPGPTVGGYLAAGGFGPRSAQYGGFWDNVLEVSLLNGRGEVQRVTAGDARFLWLFGAMGQLGIVLEATLAVVPLQPGAPPYPEGRALVAPQLAPPKIPPEYATQENESLFWFTLFVPDERLDEAHGALTALERRHTRALRFQERYRYPIALRGGGLPPLLYPEARPVTATGAWGWLRDKSPDGTQRLLEFDADFMALALGDPGYRRYVQSELPGGPEVYANCFGAQAYGALRRLKDELDPRGLLNRGSVFPAP